MMKSSERGQERVADGREDPRNIGPHARPDAQRSRRKRDETPTGPCTGFAFGGVERRTMLERLGTPADLSGLSRAEIDLLAKEIRNVLIQVCAVNGGHLAPNLGVVELTLALHRVLDMRARQGRLGRQPSVVRAQAADRARRAHRHAAPRRRRVGLRDAHANRSSTRSAPATRRRRSRRRSGMATARDLRGGERNGRGGHRRRRADRRLGLRSDQQRRADEDELHRDPQRQRDVDRPQRRFDRLVPVGAALQAAGRPTRAN